MRGLQPILALLLVGVVGGMHAAEKYERGGISKKTLKIYGVTVEEYQKRDLPEPPMPKLNLDIDVAFETRVIPLPNGCELEAAISYIDLVDQVQVDATIDNRTCAASYGEYAIRVHTESKTGATQIARHVENWRRTDAETVEVTKLYPLDGRLRQVRIRSSTEAGCLCGDAESAIQALPPQLLNWPSTLIGDRED